MGDPYSKDVTEAIEQDAEIIVVQADDADEKVGNEVITKDMP